ncbi:hypothetical protein [Stenotrophomonas forensis]
MKRDDFRWVAVDREDLLDLLLGEFSPPEPLGREPPRLNARGTKLAVGFRALQGSSRQLPALVVVPDSAVAETFSWLRTFAEETSPLSQYARVISQADWESFSQLSATSEANGRIIASWACVALGEAISQVDGDTGLKNLPLSRLAGCFTMPVARASVIWKSDHATQQCVERLQILENEKRFARRPVGVKKLAPVWAISGAQINDYLEPDEATTLVLEVAARHFRRSSVNFIEPESILSGFPALFSNSIEDRVGAFNALASEVQNQSTESPQGARESILSITVAAAAFLVGRGTSHLFLVQRLQRHVPSAPAWFGAIASLTGPRFWDKHWLRAVKGAERLLRPEFTWTEPSAADICWTEMSWLAGNFDGLEVLIDLPKMLPRTLNIEIVAGATCQLRIAGEAIDSYESRHERKPIVASPSTDREHRLEEALGQFLALATSVDSLLGTVRIPKQKSLELEPNSPSEMSSKTRKLRRQPRNS